MLLNDRAGTQTQVYSSKWNSLSPYIYPVFEHGAKVWRENNFTYLVDKL